MHHGTRKVSEAALARLLEAVQRVEHLTDPHDLDDENLQTEHDWYVFQAAILIEGNMT